MSALRRGIPNAGEESESLLRAGWSAHLERLDVEGLAQIIGELESAKALAQARMFRVAQAVPTTLPINRFVDVDEAAGMLGVSRHPTAEPGPEWLDASGVAERFGLDRRWLQDHAAELKRLKIVSAPSRKVRLFHRVRLARYLDARCV